jgi:hypothetical protein
LPGRAVARICDFQPHVEVDLSEANIFRAKAQLAADDVVCDHVKAGKVAYLPARKLDEPKNIPVPRGGAIRGIVADIKVDFRNVGKPQRLQLIETSATSEHGCGEDLTFRLVPTADNRDDAKLLEALQDRSPPQRRTGYQTDGLCHDGAVRWFRLHGKTYLETQSRSVLAPENEDEEYWFVSTVLGGRARRVCAGDYLRMPPNLLRMREAGDLVDQ